MRTEKDFVRVDAANSQGWHWEKFPGWVTAYSQFQSAFDLDSNDEVSRFRLRPEEAQKLVESLSLEPPPRDYRCARGLAKGWAGLEICDGEAMKRNGFVGFAYRSPPNGEVAFPTKVCGLFGELRRAGFSSAKIRPSQPMSFARFAEA